MMSIDAKELSRVWKHRVIIVGPIKDFKKSIEVFHCIGLSDE